MRLRVIDIETSGGSPSEIIEIAAVDVVQTDGMWRSEAPRSRLFRPNGAITFHAMAIHHLTPSHFDPGLPCCDDRQLIAFLNEGEPVDYLVAHNVAFESAHIRVSVTGETRWICTVKGARHAWPDAPGHSNQVLRYWRGFDLDPALAMPPHRAAPDAWVTAHILIDLLRSCSVVELADATHAPRLLDKIPFGRYRGEDWSLAPADYLRWLISEPDMAADVVTRAKTELAGRPTPAPVNEGTI